MDEYGCPVSHPGADGVVLEELLGFKVIHAPSLHDAEYLGDGVDRQRTRTAPVAYADDAIVVLVPWLQ